MSLDDWTSTPNSSNITESAHVETNCHMGTCLSLLEGIDRSVLVIVIACHISMLTLIHSAHSFDKLMEDKVWIAQETGVLPNHLNTEKHWMNKNLGYAIKHSKVVMDNLRVADKFEDLDTQLAEAWATICAIKEEKKQLRQEMGLKWWPKCITKLGQHLLDLDSEAANPASMLALEATTGPLAPQVTTDMGLSATTHCESKSRMLFHPLPPLQYHWPFPGSQSDFGEESDPSGW